MNPTRLPDLPLAPMPAARSPLPRAVWIGFAVLGLVTTALAGALVMRPASPPALPDAALSSAGTPMTDVPAAPAQRQTTPSHRTARNAHADAAAPPRADPDLLPLGSAWAGDHPAVKAVAVLACLGVEGRHALPESTPRY